LERLVDRLVKDGLAVTVVDPYAVQTSSFTLGRAEDGALTRADRRGGWWVLGRSLAAHSRGALVHFHMSAGKRFYGIARLLLLLTRRARHRVLTIHSGSFLKEFQRLGLWQRRRAIHALESFEDIICVNEDQRAFLDELLPCRLHVIPAFLPCPMQANPCIPEDAEALLRETDAAILTSGSGEPVYDFATVLRGVERAQERTRMRLGLILATYKKWNPDYWGQIEQALARTSVRVVVTRNLRPDEFVRLAARARLYVRGSLTDGDAMAIREAGAAGAQVLATNAVWRPEGTALFPSGDAEPLANLLLRALEDRELGRLADGSAADNYAAIREVYGLPQPKQLELVSAAR
jgi:glycosyltransferase involved in cell wall biosynthesis